MINDKGYLTSHQSLKDYVKKSDLVDFVTESELDEVKKALKYVSLKDDIKEFAKKSDVPTKTSQLFNDSGYLTKHQSLDGYVKDSELSKYISRDEFENRINSLDIIDDLEKYLTKDDIKNIAYVSDIPTKLSDMFNDVGYLTKHQSLDGYVKKSDTDIFVTKPEIDDIIEKINTIKLEGFVTQNELELKERLNLNQRQTMKGTDNPSKKILPENHRPSSVDNEKETEENEEVGFFGKLLGGFGRKKKK